MLYKEKLLYALRFVQNLQMQCQQYVDILILNLVVRKVAARL